MKTTLLIIALVLTFNTMGQLPTIRALGGEGTNIIWGEIKKTENAKEGPGFFAYPCAETVTPIKASSTLPPQGKANYSLNNISDFDPMTAWVEGKPDYGIGEYIIFKGI